MLSDFDARRILVCLRYGIGDVVMERPVLDALRHSMPQARITALGAAPAVELLDDDPVVDEVVSIQHWGLKHRWDAGTPESRAAVGDWLDERGFDLFLDVHHAAPGVSDVVWGRGIRSLEASEQAEADAVAAGADGVSAIKAAVRVGWGMEVPDSLLPRLPLGWKERRFASEFLDCHGLGAAGPIGVSPVASNPLKRWPVERFAAVADQLVEQGEERVLLFCGPQTGIAAELLGAMRHPGAMVPVGAFHLKRVAALLARCSAFVSNDTGLMHISAAVATPTLGIFGPTAPSVYCPPQEHAGSAGGDAPCPHRNLDSLHPPACWAAGECLIAEQGCTHLIDQQEVLDRLTRARRHMPPEEDPLQATG